MVQKIAFRYFEFFFKRLNIFFSKYYPMVELYAESWEEFFDETYPREQDSLKRLNGFRLKNFSKFIFLMAKETKQRKRS